jgi:hypothetical protein
MPEVQKSLFVLSLSLPLSLSLSLSLSLYLSLSLSLPSLKDHSRDRVNMCVREAKTRTWKLNYFHIPFQYDGSL